MLLNTFVHLPGIGEKTERALWDAGIYSWDMFREPYPETLPAKKIQLIRGQLSREADFIDNLPPPGEYGCRLNPSQHWRLFPHYRESTVFLDLETSGSCGGPGEITTIALYDGTAVYTYVAGENLDDFPGDLARYGIIVSYNGKSFDVPVLERFFGIRLRQVHIDLCHLLRGLGYKGGLKQCEKRFGLDRGGLAGVDGYFAVLFWQEYLRSGNRRALETLLAYNIEDAVNLEPLMIHAYNLKVAGTPFGETHRLPLPAPPFKPYLPDAELVEGLKRKMAAPHRHPFRSWSSSG